MRGLIVLTLVGSVAAGCKPKGAVSGVQSLENFASGKALRPNVCSGDPARIEPEDMRAIPILIESNDPKRKADLLSVAELAMGAVPYDMKRILRIDNGKVLITPKASTTYCRTNLLSSGSDEVNGLKGLTSCFLRSGVAAGVGAGATLVISDNPVYVAHILLRLVGVGLSQNYADSFSTIKNGQLTANTATNFEARREILTKAFLTDMVESNGLFKLSNLERLVGHDAERIITGNLKAGRDPLANLTWAAGPGQPAPGAAQRFALESAFRDFVFGEAFDSYYCNAWDKTTATGFDPAIESQIRSTKNLALFGRMRNTQQIMRKFFPKTLQAFEPMAEHLQSLGRAAWNTASVLSGLPPRYPEAAPAARTGQAGFGLASPYESSTQEQRDIWWRQAQGQADVVAAKNRYDDMVSKYNNAWFASESRYGYQKQEALFQLQRAQNAAFNRLAGQAPTYKGPTTLENPRDAYNKALNEHIDNTTKTLKEYGDTVRQDGRAFNEYMQTVATNSNSPTLAAAAAGIGQLGDSTSNALAGVNSGFWSAAGGTAKFSGNIANNALPVASGALDSSAEYLAGVANRAEDAAREARARGESGAWAATASAGKEVGNDAFVGVGRFANNRVEDGRQAQDAYWKWVDQYAEKHVNLTQHQGMNSTAAHGLLAFSELPGAGAALLPSAVKGTPVYSAVNALGRPSSILINSMGYDPTIAGELTQEQVLDAYGKGAYQAGENLGTMGYMKGLAMVKSAPGKLYNEMLTGRKSALDVESTDSATQQTQAGLAAGGNGAIQAVGAVKQDLAQANAGYADQLWDFGKKQALSQVKAEYGEAWRGEFGVRAADLSQHSSAGLQDAYEQPQPAQPVGRSDTGGGQSFGDGFNLQAPPPGE